MSKADKMFETLGYEKRTIYSNYIKYILSMNGRVIRVIVFDDDGKYCIPMEINSMCNIQIKSDLHLAIHEKMKELGWLE